MTARRAWTAEEVRALGARTDLVTACEAVLGIGKTKAWEALHRGELPFPTIRCGRRVVVPVAPLLELLCLTPVMSEAGPASPAVATTVPSTPEDSPRHEQRKTARSA